MNWNNNANKSLHGRLEKDDNSKLPEYNASQSPTGISLTDVDSLDYFEMLYHLFKASGSEMIGSSTCIFAVFQPKTRSLTVFTRKEKFLNVISHETDAMVATLKRAQAHGASFFANGDQVSCTIDDIHAQGSTYGEAALRALLTRQLQDNNETTSNAPVENAPTLA